VGLVFSKKNKEFIPHLETMDLRSIYDNVFVLGISTGPRDESGILASTIRGPFNFDEMVSEVGYMWKEDQDNAKVLIVSKDRGERSKWLDADTIDYIQLKYVDILMNKMIDKEEKYTCKVKIRG
jgi:hypothetical protein